MFGQNLFCFKNYFKCTRLFPIFYPNTYYHALFQRERINKLKGSSVVICSLSFGVAIPLYQSRHFQDTEYPTV